MCVYFCVSLFLSRALLCNFKRSHRALHVLFANCTLCYFMLHFYERINDDDLDFLDDDLCLHPLTQNDQIWRSNTNGEWLFLGDHTRPLSQGVVALADPNFEGFPLLTRTGFDLERPNSAW